jgi:hypothetical protein
MHAVEVGMRNAAIALIFAGLFTSTLVGQEPCPDPINFGLWWNSSTDANRLIYLGGFMDGQASTYQALVNSLAPNSRERLRKETFLFYDLPVLRDVMTDLYKDPANTYVGIAFMVYIARDKLGGEDVSKRLQNARIHGRSWEKFPCSTPE